jgi:hypothetical protein
MSVEIHVGNNKDLTVYRERPATRAERRRDPEAKVMAEWIHINFNAGRLKVAISRDLCD